MPEDDASLNPSSADSLDITRLLLNAREGDADASDRLFRTLQNEMRRTAAALMRSEPGNHTLQPTAVVNEAMVRLLQIDIVDHAVNRRYLFASANRAMTRALIDHARRRRADKRPEGRERVALDYVLDSLEEQSQVEAADLADAIDHLRESSPRQAEVTELRFFAGLNNEEIAAVLGIAVATVKRDWTLARAKLFRALRLDTE